MAAVYLNFFKSGTPTTQIHDSDKGLHPGDSAKKNTSDFQRVSFAVPKTESAAVRLSIGQVVIYDIADNEIARISAVVSETGWVAIPALICTGGYSWYFYPSDGDEVEIYGGILGDRDDIGLWQFKNTSRLSGPSISAADTERPMIWMSIVSGKSAEWTRNAILSEQQNFYHISLDKSLDEPGVLIQDQKIVGWTFGDLIGGGYLWKGPDEKNLVYELSVYDLYRLTFENSREEQFILAYSRKEMTPSEQLKTFANGFLRESMLSKETTPAYLKPDAVIKKMRAIISQIMDQGNLRDIVSVFDGKVLAATEDMPFILDVLLLVNQIIGPEYCLDVIENVLADARNFNDSQLNQIHRLRKDLYRKWLTLLMNQEKYARGLSVYRQAADAFIDDPGIQLLGVKLALVFGDWKTAEEILSSQQFPIDLTDQVRVLEDQIVELKFQGNKIVVRFSPGSGRIPVSGRLNNRLRQDFVIDTGASMVIIPTAAAKKLGIKIDGSVPVRELVTAGGIIEAPQITLDSIELDGWTEYNVTAYVIDMPDQSGLGLLGLNYLNRFRMDLNTKAGVLTLAPR